jgi:uncharacterized protein YbaP (TraB family)
MHLKRLLIHQAMSNFFLNLSRNAASGALLIFSTLAVFHPTLAQESLLYEVRKPGVEQVSYLYGTMHLVDETFNHCAVKIAPYLESCSVFSNEIDLNSAEQNAEIMSQMMLEDGVSLSSLYRADEYERIQSFLVEKIGPMAGMIERMQPFWILAVTSQLEEAGATNVAPSTDEVVDVVLQNMATAKGIQVAPLETVAEQMQAIQSISMKEQAAALLEYVDGGGSEDELSVKALRHCYAIGSLTCISELFEANKLASGMEQVLINERNITMGKRLTELLNTNQSVFCAVGALHLVGTTGLIADLKRRGYSVKPIVYAPCD